MVCATCQCSGVSDPAFGKVGEKGEVGVVELIDGEGGGEVLEEAGVVYGGAGEGERGGGGEGRCASEAFSRLAR